MKAIETLLGTTDYWGFLVLVVFALLGAVVNLLYGAADRHIPNPGTPYHFSLSFLTQDNIKRLVLALILIFISIRFYPDVFGSPISPLLAIGVGLGWDKLAEIIKNKTVLGSTVLNADRDKIIPEGTQRLPEDPVLIEKKL